MCKYQDCVEVCPVDCFHEGPNMLVIAKGNTSLPRFYALRYFGSFPGEDVIPPLLEFIETSGWGNDLYDTVIKLIESPEISAKSKKKLTSLIENGKVRKRKVLYKL